MSVDPRRLRTDKGFALIGVVILVAAFAMVSVVVGALYLRQLDHQRQLETQKRLETAFQGLFPGNRRPTANMWKDFGFTPDVPAVPPGGYDLACLTTRAQVGVVQASQADVALFNGAPKPALGGSLGAWNGPYWQGSVDAQNRPVDAWGRPLQLRYISAPSGWQVFSLGANGASETGDTAIPANDDLVFPQSPYVVPYTYCPTPAVSILRTSGFPGPENLTISLSWPGGTQVVVAPIDNGHPAGNPPPVFTNLPQNVSITVNLVSDQRTGLLPHIITIDTSCNATPSPITF